MMAICIVQGRTLLNHVLGLQFSIRYKFSHSAKIYANRCKLICDTRHISVTLTVEEEYSWTVSYQTVLG
jgi:hypothetical protein